MNNLIILSLINSLGVVVYVILVANIFVYGEQLFGKMSNLWGPIAFLLLFVLSALVVGLLILGKPIIFYLDKKKEDALRLLFYEIGWLFLATLIVLIIQIKI